MPEKKRIKTRQRENTAASLNPLTFGTSLEHAEEIRRTEEPTEYYKSILTAEEILGLSIPPKTFLLRGLLEEGTINIVNGARGIGKSWFVEAIANAVAAGLDFGPWPIEHTVNVLLLDGEMSLPLIKERLGLFGVEANRLSKLYIYSEAYAYRIGLNRANLLDPEWRSHIAANVKDLGIKLVILDNLSSLAPGIDENAKMDFDPINRWLLELRFSGVTIIMTHHTGKSGEQRGTSAHEDHTDTALLLSKPRGHSKSGCQFEMRVTKDRSNIHPIDNLILSLINRGKDGIGFVATSSAKIEDAITLLLKNPGLSYKEAIGFGFTRMSYYRAKNKIRKAGEMGVKLGEFEEEDQK